jgi:signal transduction histidine kinase/DNA-binding response OmpR family regulator
MDGRHIARRSFLSGGGAMGELIRRHDWSKTDLGPPESWSQSLKTAVGLLLNSGYPMYIAWGPRFVQIYNDAYRPILGETKHPAALGGVTEDTFAEIWDFIGPMFRSVLHDARASTFSDQLLALNRFGFTEECYFVFSYSPVLVETGEAGGVFVTVLETTDRVLRERRQGVLKDLAAIQSQAGRDHIFRSAVEVIGADRADAPFVALCTPGHDGAPDPAAWDVATMAGPADLTREAVLRALAEAGGSPPFEGSVLLPSPVVCEPWPEPVQRVAFRAVTPPGRSEPVGVLAIGLGPRLRHDDDYDAFLDSCALNVAALVADAEAFEVERSRAEALAQIDRAKTAFFSNVSHEFRTPLTLMLGPLEDALAETARGRPDSDQRERLETVHRNSLRLLKLVNSLLDFSRIEAGRVQAAFQPTDLAAVTADLASSFRAATDRAGLRLNVDAPPLPAPVFVDRDMWENIVLNLLSNAFKFTFEGEISVAVRAAVDQRGAEVVIRDTGVGIPSEETPRIFERFHRVEGVRGRSIEGSGIGLALVQELVRLQGGRITVVSEQGAGATFTISLPLGSDHLPAEHIRPAAELEPSDARSAPIVQEALRWLPDPPSPSLGASPRPQAGVAGEGRSVVVADDNPDMRRYLRQLLEARGYGVILATDGAEALTAIRRARPDLVLADVMMPNLDGFGLLARLREDEATRALPVIMLSARAGEEATIEGLSAGADDYLVKPFSSRELLARVGSALALADARRAASEALRAENARMRNLFRQAPGFIAVLRGPRHVFEFANAAFVRVVGERELVGIPVAEALPEVMDQGFRELLDGVFATGQRFVGEQMSVRLNRSPEEPSVERIVNFVCEPVLDDAGRVTGIFCEGHDVTEIVRAQQALVESEGRLRDLNASLEERVAEALAERQIFAEIVETTDSFIQVLDLDYRLLAINKASADECERVFGGRPKVGDSILGRLADRPEYQAAVRDAWSRALAGQEYTAVGVFGDSRFDRRYYEMKYNVLRDKTGRQIGAFQFTSDVTERLRREAELAHAQEALRHSQKMDALGQLTGGVAHDFNNLLMPIIGSLDMLQRKGPGDDRSRRMVEGALQAAERAKTLVQRLLAFARRQPLRPAAIDVGSLIEGMADLVASTTGPRVKVVVDVEAGLSPAIADPNQLEMALLNLAVNARDAMPDGGTLRMSARCEPHAPAFDPPLAPGAYLRVSVVDTGVGMDPATLARATEPFFSTKGVGEGTGLGLSMAHGLAAQLGGALSIQSEVGIGTSVDIWLPLAEAAPRPTTPLLVDDWPAAFGDALLVDDEDLVRASAREMLVDLGYRVVEAPSGEEALRLIDGGWRPDVLITDHVMPGMTGAVLAAAARERLPELPVLIISGYAEAQSAAAAFTRLAKPFRQAELAEALGNLLVATKVTPRTA